MPAERIGDGALDCPGWARSPSDKLTTEVTEKTLRLESLFSILCSGTPLCPLWFKIQCRDEVVGATLLPAHSKSPLKITNFLDNFGSTSQIGRVESGSTIQSIPQPAAVLTAA